MVDLRHLLSTVRDQGDRDTCLSIAVSDAHHAVRAVEPELSAEYLHYHSTLRDEVGVNDGVSVDAVREALLTDGQPGVSECPYSPQRRSLDWTPAAALGTVWRRRSLSIPPVWESIAAALAANRPVVLLLGITDEFWDECKLVIENSRGIPRGRHAVLAVGLHRSERRVLIRNSWGREWGVDGHAWVAATYIHARCATAITFGEPSQ